MRMIFGAIGGIKIGRGNKGPVVGSCKHDNEPSSFIIFWEILE
jgi:hypothetical protein